MLFADFDALRASGFQPKVVIVGSGPAGLAIALKLQQHKLPCLVVEAGGWDYSAASQEFYKGEIVADPYFPLHLARLRQFGGTSGHWSGWCRPLDAVDFEPNPGVPNSGWPIRKSDLDPYAKETAALLGVPTIAPDRALSGDIDQIDIIQTDPVRFGHRFRAEVERSPSIGLLLNTTVLELVPAARRIAALKVAGTDGRVRELPAPVVCVCTGGIENSRLLLWSNAQHNAGVVPQAKALGGYWMEHPAIAVADALLTDAGAKRFEGRPFFAPSPAALRRHRMGTARIWFPWLTRDSGFARDLLRQALCVAPDLSGRMMSMAGQELRCGAWLRMDFEQAPTPANRIALGRDRDAHGVPRVQLHWHKGEAERRTLLQASRLFGEALIANHYGRLRLRDWLLEPSGGGAWPAVEEYGGFHHMGGTRMGTSTETSVVDRDCKVHGVDNLFIGGSSVFPASAHANPTFTIVQLGFRLADHLHAASTRA